MHHSSSRRLREIHCRIEIAAIVFPMSVYEIQSKLDERLHLPRRYSSSETCCSMLLIERESSSTSCKAKLRWEWRSIRGKPSSSSLSTFSDALTCNLAHFNESVSPCRSFNICLNKEKIVTNKNVGQLVDQKRPGRKQKMHFELD